MVDLSSPAFWRAAALPAWCVCIGTMLPAVTRLALRNGRYFDPVWAVVFLLAVNRVSFLLHVSAIFSQASAAALALTMSGFSMWYQRRDT